MSKSVQYSTSPLLDSKTPVWRSQLVVLFAAVGFASLSAQAVRVQVVENDFYLRQGEADFARQSGPCARPQRVAFSVQRPSSQHLGEP
jgi:hypothetical protein